jgi:apolipoprotein N-acyltransferase
MKTIVLKYESLLNSLFRKKGGSIWLPFLLGAMTTLALPPIHIIPVVFFTIPGLMILIEQCTKKPFWTGWWFGFGYLATGLYWIAFALRLDLAMFFWLIPLALFAIPGIYAISNGVTSYLCYKIKADKRVNTLVFSILWSIGELLRGKFIGFAALPWNLLGYIWDPILSVMQITSAIGIYGLSLLTAFFAFLPMMWVRSKSIAVVISILLIGFGLYGYLHLSDTSYTDTKIRIVQPNIPQTEKWGPAEKQEHFSRLIEMSSKPPLDGKYATYTIWPESAIIFFIEDYPELRKDMMRHISGILLTGSIRRTFTKNRQFDKLYTSLFAIGPEGKILDVYDKMHLVPFGEFVPLRAVLPFINKITPGAVDYSPGTQDTLILNQAVPLICFEAIFPYDVDQHIGNDTERNRWLLNITNDGWFGYTTGPFQHLAIAKARAVEQGLPMVRAANTGISAVIDPYGRILQSLPLETRGNIDFYLPAPTPKITLFARYPYAGIIILYGLICALILVYCFYYKSLKRKQNGHTNKEN